MQVAVCASCYVLMDGQHHGHKIISLEKARPLVSSSLTSLLPLADQRAGELSESLTRHVQVRPLPPSPATEVTIVRCRGSMVRGCSSMLERPVSTILHFFSPLECVCSLVDVCQFPQPFLSMFSGFDQAEKELRKLSDEMRVKIDAHFEAVIASLADRKVGQQAVFFHVATFYFSMLLSSFFIHIQTFPSQHYP